MSDRGIENVRRDAAEDEGYWEALLAQGEVATPIWQQGDERRGAGDVQDGDASRTLWRGDTDDWQIAQKAFAQNGVLELTVIGYNRGGLLVQLGNLKGFVPASHLLSLPRLPDTDARLRAMAAKVGDRLHLKVIELDPQRGRLILSERAAVERTATDILQRIRPGDVLKGRVTTLRPFGAFVDLGGLEGLVHVSELAWTRVNHPGDVLQVGQEVEVYVISVNPAERKVALSLKRLQPDPWQLVSARYRVGQVISGVITNVVSFGAFARLDEGVEGLIHISELAEGNFLHPRNVVQEGDRVQARILSMDTDHHRLALSLRHVHTPRHNVDHQVGAAIQPPQERSEVHSV